jgi:plastocyanin
MKMKYLLPLSIVTGLATSFLAGCGDSGNASMTSQNQKTAPQPFTGQIVDVKMRGTAQGYKFEPAQIVIQSGDKVRFTIVDGGPHNVNFTGQRVPTGAAMILQNRGKLLGANLVAPGQTCEIEFTKDMPIGEYDFVCDAHAALGMRGKIIVN